MKNLLKKKGFYLGLAAIFAVAAGLYLSFPQGDDTNTADQTKSTQTVDTQPASNVVPAVENQAVKPSATINNQPAVETPKSNQIEPTDNISND